MDVSEIGRYRLTFDATRFSILCPRGTDRFSGMATSPLPKLYVVSVAEHPIYVGITKQSLRKRLRLGWAAAGKGGYYGYAWRHGRTEANLDVWCQTDPPDENPCLDIETIEAEVVFLIRKSGQWPAFQTEIHFHPSNDEHRTVAQRIGKKYGLAP